MLDSERPGETPDETPSETTGETPASPPDQKPDPVDAQLPLSDDAAEQAAPAKKAARKTAAKKTVAKKTAAKKTAAKKAVKKASSRAAAKKTAAPAGDEAETAPEAVTEDAPPTKKAAAKKTAKKAAAKRASKKAAPTAEPLPEPDTEPDVLVTEPDVGQVTEPTETEAEAASRMAATVPLFQAPDAAAATPRKRTRKKAAQTAPSTDEAAAEPVAEPVPVAEPGDTGDGTDAGETADDDESGTRRRPRRRGGRRRRKGGGDGDDTSDDSSERSTDDGAGDKDEKDDRGAKGDKGEKGEKNGDDAEEGGSSSASRRRRRRRRSGDDRDSSSDDPSNTVTRVRKSRSPEDEITSLQGSTRLEAKKQRRREGREAGRRRAPIVSEAEFLARRESVDRVMVIRQRDDLTQIGVLEDKVLVEHYVARESQTSLIGNVYLGRVQNVLPSMEAAFIDIGKGRNAVLYAGEVNWNALGAKDGQPRKIESVLKSGQPILVQVTKDPVGHKGARLTSQVSLPGRFLVYVPDGTTSGISRKLPDNERNRLKTLLKEIVPDSAGVIVRTAAEGASEDELTRDVERLTARWGDIETKVAAGQAPQLLYGEPDLTLKVVRDLFTEDFTRLIIQGDDAWDLVDGYVSHVAPDLRERLERYRPDDEGNDGRDLFASYRVDEQIAKGLDRKVWLPSGGSLVIDRTEAMTVVDVNTGKFTGSGGNLEETVTKNNLEAAEEIVRQLRLRDIGGIIVVDFIDMVLESNRDLVLRRMVECLGRDRTRHQVAEVTSLGLVQMTRKRIGTGLLEAFSTECEHCKGRGVLVHDHPIEPSTKLDDDARRGGRRGRTTRGRTGGGGNGGNGAAVAPSPKDVAAMAREHADRHPVEEPDQTSSEPVEQELQPEPDLGKESADTPEPVSAQTLEEPERPLASDATPTPEATVEEAPPVQAVAPAQPTEPDQPAEPAPPTVVTSTRRRSARRAAGPPVSTQAPQDAQTHVNDHDGAADAQHDGQPNGQHEGDAEGGFVLHVPIKRKGSRKR